MSSEGRQGGEGGGWWRRRRGDAAALAVVAVFFVLFFPQAVFGGKFLIAGDAFFYSYPLRTVAWEMIRGGQLPLWTPHVLSGYPLLAMAQLAIGYPLTWVYLFLPGHWAEQIYVLAPFLLSPIFTYVYARELGRSRQAALLAGLAFGYGGMMCSGISNSGMLTNSMLWLPLMLVPIDRARAGGRGRFASCLVGATAAYSMSVLNGHGQSFVYAGTLAALYGLFLTLFPVRAADAAATGEDATVARRSPPVFGRWRPLLVAIGAIGLAACVAAFQILETLRAARRSTRRALSYETLGEGSFTLTQALRSLVAPLYHYIDVTTYLPPLVIVLAVVACFVAWRRRETRDARVFFWLGVAVVAWLLMLGSNTPLHHIVHRIPFINQFRVPSRHALEWTLAVAVLSAYGWDALAAFAGARRAVGSRSPGARRLEVALALVALAGAATVGAFWWRAAVRPPVPGSNSYTALTEQAYLLWKACFALLLFVAVWLGMRMRASRLVRLPVLVAVIVLACYVEQFAIISCWWGGLGFTAERFAVVSPVTRYLQTLPSEANRVYTRVGLFAEEFTHAPQLEGANLTALYGLHNVAGMEPLILERYSRALGGVGPDSVTPRAGFPPNDDLFLSRSRVLDLLNTTHVVSFLNLAPHQSAKVFKDDIAFAPSDAGPTVAPGGRVTLGRGGGAGDTLALVTMLSNSVELEQGTTVAKVRLQVAGGAVIERELRAGIDTAEWAHERPDVRAAIRHALPPVFDSRPADESNSYPSLRYLARVPLGAQARIEKIEIENVTRNSPLSLAKATLYDSARKSSTPLLLVSSEWWEPIYQTDIALVLRNGRAQPRAWLVGEAEAVDGEEALRRIRGESPVAFDPRRTALLEVARAELPALSGGELPPGSQARIVSYEPSRIVVETKVEQPAVLVISEMNYPGWEARIDGREARIHATDYLLRGVVVPAGEHRVEMRYTAPAAGYGAIISACALLLLGGLTVYDWRARRRPPTSPGRAELFARRLNDGAARRATKAAGVLRAKGEAFRSLLSKAKRRPFMRESLIFLAFIALTALMTWPWLRHPLDTISDPGDPYIIAYTLWWDYRQTFRDPRHLFDATIFYPYRDTLAFSEHDYGIALLFFPLFAAGGRPLAVHSLATFFAFVLSGYGAFRLARTLTGSYGAAWVAGVAFAFIPYRFQRLPHLHYIFAGWIPLLLEALVLFVRARSWRRAFWLGGAFLMNALTCISWFILTLVPLGLTAAFLVVRYRAWRGRALWLRGAVALGAATLALLPFLLPYRRVAAAFGFVRDTTEVTYYSATALNWLAAAPRLKVWGGVGGARATEEMSLFPGLLLPLLAYAAVIFFNKRRARSRDDDKRRSAARDDKRDDNSDDHSDDARDERDGGDASAPFTRSQAKAEDAHARVKFFNAPARRALLLLDACAVGAGLCALLISAYGTVNFGFVVASRPEAAFVACLAAVVARACATFWPHARRALRRGSGAGVDDDADHGLETFVVGALWLAAGFAGSLGMHAFFHRFLYEHFEIFKSQRVPARWSMIAYVGLALLAGLGARSLANLLARRRSPFTRRAGVYTLVVAALLFELRVAPLEVTRGEASPDELALRLKETPMRGGLVELPATGPAIFSHMLRAADHGKPVVTATSSFLPPLMRRVEALSQQRPVPPEFLDLLESTPASYLVIHYSYMSLEDAAAIDSLLRQGLQTGRLRFIRSYTDRGRKDLYAVTRTEPAAESESDAPPELLAPASDAGAPG